MRVNNYKHRKDKYYLENDYLDDYFLENVYFCTVKNATKNSPFRNK